MKLTSGFVFGEPDPMTGDELNVLETERLLLRPLALTDAPRLNQLIDRDERVWRFDPGKPKSPQQRERYVRERMAQYKIFGFGCYAVVLRSSGEMIGQCGLSSYWYEHRNQRRTLQFEVMYHFGHAYWHQGFATEAARRWVDFAFGEARLPRLVVCPHKDNEASINVLRRLGFSVVADWLEPDRVICALHHPDDGRGVLEL